MSIILGIDLGTTKSVVGVWRNGGPFIIPDESGHRSIPSLVLVTPDEKVFAGRRAQRHPERYKSKNRTISSVKRLMGKKGETGWGWWKAYPQEVSAFVLAELKNQAEIYLGEQIRQAVIAIPSHFDESQRRATKEAAEIAGLEVVRLLNEATAAVLAYGFYNDKKSDETVLVFDLGGGTLDISIVRFGEGIYEEKCIEGDSKLGGDDFDQVIIDYILDQVHQKYGVAIELDPFQKIILKEVSEAAKIELSSKYTTSIYIPGFLNFGQTHHDLDISINRQTFERLSKNLFDRTNVLLKKALDSAKLRSADLDAVLLIGGSSRIPYFREIIRRELAIEPFTGDSETYVAQGAVIQAAMLDKGVRNVVYLPVIPSSYGIGLQGDKYSKLITKNTTIPQRSSQIFTTTADNQSTISISIYQGESYLVSDNTFLGTIELRDIPPAPRGIPQIEVNFDIDSNMIIDVSAKDLGIGKEQKTVIKSPYGLNNAQIKLMQKKMKSWLLERTILEMKAQINPLCSSIEKMLSDKTPALDWEEISTLRTSRILLSNMMAKGASSVELEKVFSSTKILYEKIQQKVNQYEKMIEKINDLKAKIEKFTLVLKVLDEKESSLLSQGGDLLQEYVQRNLPYDELHKMFSSVRAGYEGTKADLIIREIRTLVTSKQMGKWVVEIENILPNPALVRQASSRLREIHEVDLIVVLMGSEDPEYQYSIQQKVLEKIKGNSHHRAYFILIVSAFIDFHIISTIEEFPNDENIAALLAFSLFNVIDNKEAVHQRKTAAQIIARYLPAIQYLAPVVDCVSGELDATVNKYLLDYLERQPTGAFRDFFTNADSPTKTKISDNREMLVKLAMEPDEKSCLLALESLAHFPSEEVISVLLPFANNKNLNIRAKTLEIFIEFKTKDTRVAKVFTQALFDPASEIRLLALEFIEQAKETSCLTHVFALLQSEPEENVREKAVITLSNLKDVKVIPHFLKLLMDSNQKIRDLALSSLEKNMELMETDIKKLVSLIRNATQEKRSLGVKDKFFLWRLSRKYPDMNEVIQTFREISIKRV